MNPLRRRIGSPLQLLLLLASFALAGYAGVRLLDGDTLGVVLWFVGSALLHDLVLLPLYSALDRGLRGITRGRPERGGAVNFVRVPVFLSGLLLLVWFPLILGRVGHYTAATGLSADHFWEHWLLITAVLFAASAVLYAGRLLRGRRAGTRGSAPDGPSDGS